MAILDMKFYELRTPVVLQEKKLKKTIEAALPVKVKRGRTPALLSRLIQIVDPKIKETVQKESDDLLSALTPWGEKEICKILSKVYAINPYDEKGRYRPANLREAKFRAIFIWEAIENEDLGELLDFVVDVKVLRLLMDLAAIASMEKKGLDYIGVAYYLHRPEIMKAYLAIDILETVVDRRSWRGANLALVSSEESTERYPVEGFWEAKREMLNFDKALEVLKDKELIDSLLIAS